MGTRVCEHAFLNTPDCVSAQTRGAVETEGLCGLSAWALTGAGGVQWGLQRCVLCILARQVLQRVFKT